MNIKPLADRVLILPTPAEEVTATGIIIPDSAKEKPLKGKVIAVGNGIKTKKCFLRKATKSSMANMPDLKSSLKAKNILLCVRMTCSPLSVDAHT